MDNLQTMLITTMNMSFINKYGTNPNLMNTIITLGVISIITFCSKYIKQKANNDEIMNNIYSFDIFYFWYGKKNQIEYSGKTAAISCKYNTRLTITNNFSDSFRALFDYINEQIKYNNSIYKIKEISSDENSDNNKKCETFYVVSQLDRFILDKTLEIYAYTSFKSDDLNEGKDNRGTVDKIIVTLYSYKSSIDIIQEFVKKITNNYINTIVETRVNKKFIYEVVKTKYDDSKYECWNEYIFESNRTFQNLFFDRKKDVLSKIDFFLHNKEWYNEKGIPYTLGIGLHGPPGTGKTSFIKALANKTGRHIISFSFKVVKTKKDLLSIFFEDRYNTDNKKFSVGFDKKIIVFEDIDCIGDIVLKRVNENKGKNKNKSKNKSKNNFNNFNSSVSSIIDKLVNIDNDGEKESIKAASNLFDNEPITLDDILNIWDGIRETPGRIIIISSNHYDKLDPALTRPGRIDISLELTNASHDTIDEIYFNLFKIHLHPKILKKIKPNFYSPAEIFNIYMTTNYDAKNMEQRLIQNKHV